MSNVQRGEKAPDSALCRPGGLLLTDRLLEMKPLEAGGSVLDVGCGSGAAVRHMRQVHGLDAIGLDITAHSSATVIQGEAERLPFQDDCFNAVFFECSLSQVADQCKALSEARRVLKSGGILYISDMFARGEQMNLNGIIGRLLSLDAIQNSITNEGFILQKMEDYSHLLPGYFAQIIFESGDEAYNELGADMDQLRRANCGYYLAVYVKDDKLSPMHGWTARLIGVHPGMDASALRDWQLDMAAKSIVRAMQNSRFYRELMAGTGFSGVLCDGGTELSALPFTDAAMLTEHGMEMLCVPQSEVSRIRSMSTSGTTGRAKRIYFAESDLQRTVDFFSMGMRPLVQSGQKVGILMSDSKPDSIADLLRKGLAEFGVEGVIFGGIVDYQLAAQTMEGCSCLVGMPAQIYRLCKLYPGLRPQNVLLSADYIPDSIIKLLSDIWGCGVYSHYGLTETCYGLAVQCAVKEGQHIRHSDFLLEIIDPETGQELGPGRRGELVITSLRSEALPLIRYRTGDIAELTDEPCTCGCGLPRLGREYGRLANLAQPLNIHILDELMYSMDILSYSAELEPGMLKLVVEGSHVDAGAISETLGCRVELEYSHKCQLTGNGKRRLKAGQHI